MYLKDFNVYNTNLYYNYCYNSFSLIKYLLKLRETTHAFHMISMRMVTVLGWIFVRPIHTFFESQSQLKQFQSNTFLHDNYDGIYAGGLLDQYMPNYWLLYQQQFVCHWVYIALARESYAINHANCMMSISTML